MSLPPSFFDFLEDRLNLAVYDINAEHRMGRTADIRAAFGKIPAAAANLHTRYIATRTFVEMGDDIIEVDSTASADDIARNIRKIKEITDPTMSITGLQSGAFKSLLAEMKQEIATAQTQGIADVKAAGDAAAGQIKTTIDGVKAKIISEVSDALQEFAEFTNGGPA